MAEIKIIRIDEVKNICGLSKATIYRQIKLGKFPPPKKLTGNQGRAIGWLKEDVIQWVMQR